MTPDRDPTAGKDTMHEQPSPPAGSQFPGFRSALDAVMQRERQASRDRALLKRAADLLTEPGAVMTVWAPGVGLARAPGSALAAVLRTAHEDGLRPGRPDAAAVTIARSVLDAAQHHRTPRQ